MSNWVKSSMSMREGRELALGGGIVMVMVFVEGEGIMGCWSGFC